MNNKIIKLQQGDYFKWKNLSREDKVKRNKQIAKQYLDKGPSIQNYYNALKAYFGGFNPKNPYLQTGEPTILPGMNPTKGIQTSAKVARTLEDYLKTTKVTAQTLEGSSAARSAYATDRFIGGRLFQNTLPEEAMKIQGHGMAKSPTIQDALARLRYILDNGIKGKFYTAPLKVSKEAAMAGEAIGTGGATPYFDGHFLITGKPGQMINSVDDIGTIYINDAYENEEALKAAQKMKEYLTKTYPNKVFKLYSEGFKKGGTIKAANARKWKHKEGGSIEKLEKGSWINFLNESGLGKTLLEGGLNFLQSSSQNKSIAGAIDVAKAELDKEKQEASDYALQMATKKAQEIQLIDPNNPNAFGGSIVQNYIRQQLYNDYLNYINQDIANRKAQLDMQSQQMQNENTSGAISGIIQSGLGVVGNLLGGKKDISSTNSTTYNGLRLQ